MNKTISRYCIESELEYSCALGGSIERFGSCLAVINPRNKVLGDYNRVFVREESNVDALIQDIKAAGQRFVKLGIPVFVRVETFPDIGQEFVESLIKIGCSVSEHTYFALENLKKLEFDKGIIKVPSNDEYLQWYERKCRKYPDFDERWWIEQKTSRLSYIDIFRPYWFYVDGVHVGYMDCAQLSGYTCIHDVNIYPEYRNKGFGLEMNCKVIRDKATPVVGSISRSTGRFYAKLGFEFACSTQSVNVEGILKG